VKLSLYLNARGSHEFAQPRGWIAEKAVSGGDKPVRIMAQIRLSKFLKPDQSLN